MHAYFAIFIILLLNGCTHSIAISPDLQSIKKDPNYIEATAGYYISPQDIEKQVIGPGGGSDKVSYYPYKALEGALITVLSSNFEHTEKLNSPITAEVLKAKGIKFAFLPEISTESHSNNNFIWPPTHFTVTIALKAFSADGKIIWERKCFGIGEASPFELRSDNGLAAKRASEKAFFKISDEISNSSEFRK